MKSWLAVLLACVVLQSGPALSASWRDMRVAQAQGQSERHERGSQRQRDADRPQRAERQERPQRMSDEERRGLHRDLDKARREIYKPRRDR